jgi:excisionase family DNA binding protein
MRQAADYLNISYRTMRRRVMSGEIGHVVVGARSIRITDEQLADYIERNTVDASLAV